eukprot:3625895-Amphidinium_carterae.1
MDVVAHVLHMDPAQACNIAGTAWSYLSEEPCQTQHSSLQSAQDGGDGRCGPALSPVLLNKIIRQKSR